MAMVVDRSVGGLKVPLRAFLMQGEGKGGGGTPRLAITKVGRL